MVKKKIDTRPRLLRGTGKAQGLKGLVKSLTQPQKTSKEQLKLARGLSQIRLREMKAKARLMRQQRQADAERLATAQDPRFSQSGDMFLDSDDPQILQQLQELQNRGEVTPQQMQNLRRGGFSMRNFSNNLGQMGRVLFNKLNQNHFRSHSPKGGAILRGGGSVRHSGTPPITLNQRREFARRTNILNAEGCINKPGGCSMFGSGRSLDILGEPTITKERFQQSPKILNDGKTTLLNSDSPIRRRNLLKW